MAGLRMSSTACIHGMRASSSVMHNATTTSSSSSSSSRAVLLISRSSTPAAAWVTTSWRRQLQASVRCAAAGDAPPPGPDLASRIKDDMKAAMKARDAGRLDAVRNLMAAVKSREIELREGGKQVADADVLAVINKLAKQRRDSIEQYTAGGRADLAAKESAELDVLTGYLPRQMSREEVAAIVAAAVAELGATSVKQMGVVIKKVAAATAGAADNKTISELAKEALAQKS